MVPVAIATPDDRRRLIEAAMERLSPLQREIVSGLIAFDDDLGTVDAVWAERDSFHDVPPPFASMCGQTAARKPFAAPQEPRTSRSSPSTFSRPAIRR